MKKHTSRRSSRKIYRGISQFDLWDQFGIFGSIDRGPDGYWRITFFINEEFDQQRFARLVEAFRVAAELYQKFIQPMIAQADLDRDEEEAA